MLEDSTVDIAKSADENTEKLVLWSMILALQSHYGTWCSLLAVSLCSIQRWMPAASWMSCSFDTACGRKKHLKKFFLLHGIMFVATSLEPNVYPSIVQW